MHRYQVGGCRYDVAVYVQSIVVIGINKSRPWSATSNVPRGATVVVGWYDSESLTPKVIHSFSRRCHNRLTTDERQVIKNQCR